MEVTYNDSPVTVKRNGEGKVHCVRGLRGPYYPEFVLLLLLPVSASESTIVSLHVEHVKNLQSSFQNQFTTFTRASVKPRFRRGPVPRHDQEFVAGE
jgi:hypothetical protein